MAEPWAAWAAVVSARAGWGDGGRVPRSAGWRFCAVQDDAAKADGRSPLEEQTGLLCKWSRPNVGMDSVRRIPH